ncbi:MAG: hypothetical protein LBI04_12510, partial [Treponema sp.]|nr:hypothetical protein [Treponema sp.]
MKTLNFKVKIFMLLCVGALFFSCALFDHDEYGTLVINLPGSNSSRAIDEKISYDAEEGRYKYFLDNLIYRVECSGPSRIEPQDFKPPSNKISMRLPVGDWTVTVKVYNAKDENIALSNNTDSTTIEEGKTSEINLLSIGIDTKRCDIASFKITSPVTAVGTINTNNLITVNVPNGTDVTAMGYSLTHTGRTIEPAASGTLSFTDTKSFTVTAVNGDEKPYIVEVVVAPPVDIGGGIPAWV